MRICSAHPEPDPAIQYLGGYSVKKLLMVTMMASLVACTSFDPYTGEEKTSKTVKGAGIGAASGALLGAAVSKNNRGKGALIGALAGAAVGGGVGNYMDRQDAKLREELEGTGVRVVRNEADNSVQLIMPGNITFQTGSDAIRSDFYPVLDSVSKVLKEFDKTSVQVTGHTDNVGTFQKNQALSEKRASSVASYLSSRGVASSRLHTRGASSSEPIASNNTAAGREQNRRVEIQLKPME